MKTNEILHILRNSYGHSEQKKREVRLSAANEIERWKEAFENLQEWAEKCGLDTATKNR